MENSEKLSTTGNLQQLNTLIKEKQEQTNNQQNNKNKKNKRNNRNKNDKNNQKNENEDNEKSKEIKKDWKCIDYTKDLKSEKFNFYYKAQLKQYFDNDDQFELFLEKLREKLPCVFRINPAHPYAKEFKAILDNPNFLDSFNTVDNTGNSNQKANAELPLQEETEEEQKQSKLNLTNNEDNEEHANINYNNNNENQELSNFQSTKEALEKIKISPFNLTNIPKHQNMIYYINIPRFELKRNHALSNFHKFIQKSVDSGLISRQEAVSMIPPLLMEVLPGEAVFDTCAAPGSKTAQLLEEFYRDFDFLNPDSILNDSGIVIANDNNFNRAYMMCHQLKRLNTAGMMIVSHDAQFLPSIYKSHEERFMFDKILCDVPCSSDAVMRKLPHKWKVWSPRDSFALHKLQLQILKRGIALLKVGGRIIYSTCSLNPVENEAVVCEIMRNYKDSLEIEDMSSYFEGSDIKIRPGLTSWKIFTEDKTDNKKLVEIKSKEDQLYELNKNQIEETVFGDDEETCRNVYKLQNCIRLFPHDNDTSGFFITVFRKKSPLLQGTEKQKRPERIVHEDKGVFFLHDYPNIIDSIKDYYGLSPEFPFEQVVTHSKIQKKLSFVSKGVYNLLKYDNRNQLKIMAVGVKLFSINRKTLDKSGQVEQCLYRVCQDGLMYAIPFMRKRVYFCDQDLFVQLIKGTDVRYTDLPGELKGLLEGLSTGCVVMILLKDFDSEKFKHSEIFELDKDAYLKFLRENYLDAICCYNSSVRLSSMINKEHQHVFNMKYNL